MAARRAVDLLDLFNTKFQSKLLMHDHSPAVS